MRILVLLTDAFGGKGGIALFNRNLLTVLDQHPKITKIIVIARLAFKVKSNLPPKVTYVTKGINSKALYLITALHALIKYRKFDYIICGHVHLTPVGFCFRLCLRKPLLLIIHGIEAWTPLKNPLVNFCVKRIDAFITVSHLTKKRFLNWTNLAPTKGFVLPNAVDFNQFKPGPKNSRLLKRYGLNGKRVLMTLGWLRSEKEAKGFDEVINLIPQLIRRYPDLVYMIVGEGDDKSRLINKVRCLGVSCHVIFTGYIPESEKADHYRLADAYVMPSRGEGFGFVFLEAMACGVPVVASKVDGGREALRNGKLGVLVNPVDVEETKQGIFKALEKQHGVVQHELYYFSLENFKFRLNSILNQILKWDVSEI